MSAQQHWWLSFADPQAHRGRQFLGVAIVSASNFEAAVARARALGINPGGEVIGIRMPDDEMAPLLPHVDKLLSKDEVDAIGGLEVRI